MTVEQRVNVSTARVTGAEAPINPCVAYFFIARTGDFHFESAFSFRNSLWIVLRLPSPHVSRIVAVFLDFARPLSHHRARPSAFKENRDKGSLVGDTRGESASCYLTLIACKLRRTFRPFVIYKGGNGRCVGIRVSVLHVHARG